MPLTHNAPVGFIPTRDAEAARKFYEETLGLTFVSDDPFALVFRVGKGDENMLRVVRAPKFQPMDFTIYGWESTDIQADVDELTKKGVVFERYGFLDQDERGIWKAGDRDTAIAWFKDPDGNTLSLSQH